MKTKNSSKKVRNRSKTRVANVEVPELTVGIDLGDRNHAMCVMDGAGEIVEERKIVNDREALRLVSERYEGARIVMEVGSHNSPCISRLFEEREHEVYVANARKLRAIYQNDKLDAQMQPAFLP